MRCQYWFRGSFCRFGAAPLLVAASYNFADVISLLLKRKDLDLNVASSNGTTSLMNAAYKGFFDIVSFLTLDRASHNLNINAQNRVSFAFPKAFVYDSVDGSWVCYESW